MDKLPRGLSRKANGIRIRVYRNGKKAHDETLIGNPYSAALVKAARARASHVRECLSLGLPIDESSPAKLFPDACQDFLDTWQGDPDVRQKYRNILQSVWMPVFHRLTVSQITDTEIQRRLRERGVKIKTQKNYLSPLSLVLDAEKVTPNPAKGIRWNKKIRTAEKPEIFRYTPQQQADIIAAIDWLHDEAVREQEAKPRKRFRTTWTLQAKAFFPMLFAFGPRPGECLALRWEDWEDPRFYIHATHSQGKRKEMTKTGERRRVYVPEWVRPRMLALPTRFKGGPLFQGHLGDPLMKKANLNGIWREALALCGLPDQDPYVCRHSRAAELLSAGKASIRDCAYQMGHTEAVFLNVYSEMIEQFRPQQDWDQFERQIAPASPQWSPGEVINIAKSKG